jgi:hypothetical protein
VPADRRAEAFRMNDGGWTGQIRNIGRYVSAWHLGGIRPCGAVWALGPAHLQTARGYLDEISIQWDRALDRLKKLVEE